MARGTTRKQNIIAMQGGFHGRTIGTMAITKSKTIYADGSGPLMVRPLCDLPRPLAPANLSCTHDITAWRDDGTVPVLAPLQLYTGRGRRRARARVAVPAGAATPPAERADGHGRSHY